MSPTLPAYTHTHLAVDFQNTFLYYIQPRHKKELIEKEVSFVKRLRDLFVPTIWTAIDNGDALGMSKQELADLYRSGKIDLVDMARELMARPNRIMTLPMTTAWPSDPAETRDREQLEKYGLMEVGAKKDEIIHLRSRSDNPFDNHKDFGSGRSVLAKIVKQTFQAKQQIITGLNSSECVAGTLFGALLEGQVCHVVTDLIADRAEGNGKLNREWHEKAVMDKLLWLILESDMDSRQQKQLVYTAMNSIHFTTSEKLINELESKPAPPRVPVHYLADHRNG